MYYEDLTEYAYARADGSLNIGWLDSKHPYRTGPVPALFLKRLWEYFRYPVQVSRGFHTCNICPLHNESELPVIGYGKELRKAGFYEIRVLGKKDKIYAAPSLLFHYITAHGYQPPQEFIHAVLKPEGPDVPAYQFKIKNLCAADDYWWREDHTIIKMI